MELNVSNIPMNTLYKFGDNYYVISLMLDQTRNNTYPLDKPKRFTEVYKLDPDGIMTRVTSGILVDNSAAYNFNEEFAIRDYDMDDIFSFKVNMPLKEVGLEELYKVRDAIARSYKASKK